MKLKVIPTGNLKSDVLEEITSKTIQMLFEGIFSYEMRESYNMPIEKLNEDQLEIPTYQEEVLENYKKLARMNLGGKIEWVDASIGEEELTETIGTLILNFLKIFK